MALYFVDGIAGNNGNSGTTPSQAKASWSAAEALALVGGDSVIGRGPCSYREAPTTSHNGTVGNPISYIGDEAGLYFPTGGEVRIAGSDNDQSIARVNCLIVGNSNRTFRGLHFNGCSGAAVALSSNVNQIIEDCVFADLGANSTAVSIAGASQASAIVRKCQFNGLRSLGVGFSHSATIDNANHLVENCTFVGNHNNGAVQSVRVGGITVRGCNFVGCNIGPRVVTGALSVGQTMVVQGCIIVGSNTAFFGLNLGDITEDYNALFGNSTDRNTVNVGAHSISYLPGYAMPLLTLGVSPMFTGLLASYSQVAALSGANLPSDDQFGTLRAATPSWGAVQYIAGQRPFDAGQPRNSN